MTHALVIYAGQMLVLLCLLSSSVVDIFEDGFGFYLHCLSASKPYPFHLKHTHTPFKSRRPLCSLGLHISH